ncbi:restriction endonuclease subunit S, partial [Akkermansiaceae bacterium]|nr:restriction endonuclease subunit S [Akkermansiaceae bacterium]
ISEKKILFISEEKHQQLRKGHLRENDILFINRGEIGKTALVDENFNNSNLNSQIAWLRCEKALHFRFLFHYLNSPVIRRLISQLQTGAALQQLPIRILKTLPIIFPCLVNQRLIADNLDALSEHTRSIEALYTQKLNDLKELKQSLLQQAFAGELTKEDAA